MFFKNLFATAAACLLAAEPACALKGSRDPLLPRSQYVRQRGVDHSNAATVQNLKRQYYPANATDVKTITTPTNVTIRYKMPEEAGVCETTPGKLAQALGHALWPFLQAIGRTDTVVFPT